MNAEQHHGDVTVRSLYVAPNLARVGATCRTLNVSPLLREMIKVVTGHFAQGTLAVSVPDVMAPCQASECA